MKKIVIYGHGGSQNHGNEAIVRGIHELFPDERLTLYSSSPEVDKKFGLGDFCDIRQGYQELKRNSLLNFFIEWVEKYLNWKTLRYRYAFRHLLRDFNKDAIYVLEAGDQYCEHGNHRECYAFLNSIIRRRGGVTVMLGCTINPDVVNKKEVITDLKNYSLIVARESITYDSLKTAGIDNNLEFAPCPAFAMKSEPCQLPDFFYDSEVVGINIGFLAQCNEIYLNNLLKNYENVIQYILDNTEYKIALLPHVNWDYNFSDFIMLDKLYEKFQKTGRVFLLEERNAPQQKYIISKLKFFIVLRTHATVPALEQNVPVLITGYKVKSTGISKDIFKDQFDVLASVQTLNSEFIVRDKFKYILENEKNIRDYLKLRMPEYLKQLQVVKKLMLDL